MRKALVESVDAYSHSLTQLLTMLLPEVAKGQTVAGGFVGTKDRKDQAASTMVVKDGEYTFTVDHPVSPDGSEAPTRLVVHGHNWVLYRGSVEAASGILSSNLSEKLE